MQRIRGGDPSVLARLLERLAAGGRLLGLVEAVEPGAAGEWWVRLRLAGEVTQVRSLVPVEVGSVQAFRAPDARRPRCWSVVPAGLEGNREPRLAEAGPGTRLGRALVARRTDARVMGAPTLPATDPPPVVDAAAGTPGSSRSGVLALGSSLLPGTVRAAFEVFADHVLLRALVEEAASDARSAAAVDARAVSDRGDAPARDALRALASGVVEFGRAVDRGCALLPIPIPFEQARGLRELRCYVATDDGAPGAQSRKSPGDVFLVVLLLELSELGALRIDVRSGPGGFLVRFAAVSDAVRGLLDARLESIHGELAAGLDAAGLQAAIEVAIAEADESTPLLRELDEIDRVVRGVGGLDVHA